MISVATAAWTLALAGACHHRQPTLALDGAPGPVFPPPPNPPQVVYVGEVSRPGGGLQYPLDVACRGDHHLAIADAEGGAVWQVDLATDRWTRVDHVGTDPLQAPVGVTFEADGALLIADSGMAAVLRQERPRAKLQIVSEGSPLVRPAALAALDGGGFLVVDPGAHALFRYLPGQGMAELGPGRGTPGQGFNFPVDVALGSDGSAFVCDALNGVITRVAEGQLTPVAGGLGAGGAALVRPKGLAVEADGTLHVADAGMQHVQVYNHSGELLGRYGFPGDGPGGLGLPAGICLDGDGHAFVADPVHHRIQVFALLWRRDDDGARGEAP